MTNPRQTTTYRGARRNAYFGRKSRGNTKPQDRYRVGLHKSPATTRTRPLRHAPIVHAVARRGMKESALRAIEAAKAKRERRRLRNLRIMEAQ